jgi:Zn-dependent membrane protease YugP
MRPGSSCLRRPREETEMFVFDPMYFLFLLPGLLFMLWAQMRVRGAYGRYGQVPNAAGLTGAQAARRVLDREGLGDVAIEAVPGELTDHYDPRSRVLRLSEGIYGQRSVAAVAVAAHEAGHAIQHAQAYGPFKARTAIVPAVNIGSTLGFVVLLIGVIVGSVGLGWIGVGLFALATVFALLTLPVEFDASNRAKQELVSTGIVDGGSAGGAESQGVARVLNAAAWTYVAGFATSLLTLVYYVSLVTGINRDE